MKVEVRNMRNYRARSYSEVARYKAKRYIEFTIEQYEQYGVEVGKQVEQECIDAFNNSYRCPLIITRAAGIYGRKIREYKRRKGIE